MAVGRVGTNNFSCGNYIVDINGLDKGATHTSIVDALADASAGEDIILRPGTYTENFTLKSDVNIYGLGVGAHSAGDVLIEGKMTVGTCERCELKGLRFINNGDVILEDTGSSTDSINFVQCTFNGDGSFNMFECSNTTKNFFFFQCNINCSSGSKVINSSGGNFYFYHSIFSTDNADISTLSAGHLFFTHCFKSFAFQTTGTASYETYHSTFSTNNKICIDHQGSGGGLMLNNSLRTNGTVAAMNIASGSTVVTTQLDINTTNNTPISGDGNIWYDSIGFVQGGNHTIAPTRLGGAMRIGLLRLATALDEVYGGTGQTSFTTGDILYASASNTLSKLAAGTNGHVLTLAAGVPSWAAPSGGSTPDKEYYFKASDFDALETNFAPLLQDNGSTSRVLVRAFDDTTEEFVNFSIKAPSDIDTSGTVTFRVWMYAATAVASRFVQLTFDHRAVDNSESWDGAYTSEDSGDIAIGATQDDITEATWTETVSNLTWAADDFIMCRLSRIAPSGTNLSGDLYIVGFAVEIPRS